LEKRQAFLPGKEGFLGLVLFLWVAGPVCQMLVSFMAVNFGVQDFIRGSLGDVASDFLGMRPVGMFLMNHERPGAIGIEIIRYLF